MGLGNGRQRLAQFGQFELNLDSRELSKDGIRIRLEVKPAQLLCVLVERAGELVSRKDLMELLWADGEHVDFDHGLNKSINKLRLALGDEPSKPVYIETLSRRGYRFIASVSIDEALEQKPENPLLPYAESQPLQDQRKTSSVFFRKRGALIGLTATFVSAVAVAAIGLRFRDKGEVAATVPLHSVVLQKEGALDPVDEGFKVHGTGNFEGQVVRNVANYGFDRWRTISDDSGYYYKPFTEAEKDFAAGRDWRLTCVCAAEAGDAFAAVSFGENRDTMRFDIVLLREGGKYFVALTKKISPAWEFEKVEFPGVTDVDHPHTYQLRYNHVSKSASLWVDDKQLLSDYRGVDQFREDRGLFFGSFAAAESKTGVGLFRSVRFEAY